MVLIEDLGTRLVNNKQPTVRFGVYECPICLCYFETRTSDVNRGKASCKPCVSLLVKNRMAESFIDTCYAIHGLKYAYNKVVYLGDRVKVEIYCNSHKEYFWQTPHEHKKGAGCPACAQEIRSISMRTQIPSGKPTILYYVYFPEFTVWKIGCTNKGVFKRFSYDDTHIEILYTKTYVDSREAYTIESWLLKYSYGNRVQEKPLASKGNTELRSKPIEQLHQIIKMAEVSFRVIQSTKGTQ